MAQFNRAPAAASAHISSKSLIQQRITHVLRVVDGAVYLVEIVAESKEEEEKKTQARIGNYSF